MFIIISQSLWSSPVHRETVIRELRSGNQLQFINMLINNTAFLVDLSLQLLRRIKETEEAQDDTCGWEAQTTASLHARLRQMANDKLKCLSHLIKAKFSVDILRNLTSGAPEPFLCPEFVDRVATKLNSYLQQIFGPKRKNFEIKNMDNFRWGPYQLFIQVIDIYLHLDSDVFAKALANDERSFCFDLFGTLATYLERASVHSSHQVPYYIN